MKRSVAPDETRSRAPELGSVPDDPVGIMLYGIVMADGKPLTADVSISLVRRESGEWTSFAKTGLNAPGTYAVMGLAPGHWALVVSSRGFRDVDQTLELSAAHARNRLDLILERATVLKVKILTPGGQILTEAIRADPTDTSGVSAVATLEPPEGDLPMMEGETRWYREGTYYGDDVQKGYGELELRSGPPIYVSAVLHHLVLETKLVPSGSDEVVFTIPTERVKRLLATVKLKLVDAESGTPISTQVMVYDGRPYTPRTMTSADGTLMRDGLRPGLVQLGIEHHPGFETVRWQVRVEPGRITDLGTFRLSKAATIDGVVVDERGAPVEAYVSYRNLEHDDPPQPWTLSLPRRTQPDGAFKIPNAGRGRGLLSVRAKPSSVLAAIVDTTSGAATVRLTVRPCTPLVLQPRLERGDRYLVTITDEADTPWYSLSFDHTRPMKLVIPPGRYTVRIHDDKGVRRASPLIVGSEPVDVPIGP